MTQLFSFVEIDVLGYADSMIEKKLTMKRQEIITHILYGTFNS